MKLRKQASTLKEMLVANSVFTLGIIRTLAQNELDFCIRHQHQCEDEPSLTTVSLVIWALSLHLQSDKEFVSTFHLCPLASLVTQLSGWHRVTPGGSADYAQAKAEYQQILTLLNTEQANAESEGDP